MRREDSTKDFPNLVWCSWPEARKRVQISPAQLSDVKRKMQSLDEHTEAGKMWEFLVACGYALHSKGGVERLARVLCGNKGPSGMSSNGYVWIEGMPLSARIPMGDTHLDLALGCIMKRRQLDTSTFSDSGIEYSPSPEDPLDDWACFVEVKVKDDIQPGVANDPNFNQLARIIETAVTFQKHFEFRFPERIFVTLLTPAKYQGPEGRTKRYSSFFREYERDPRSIIEDIQNCSLPKREQDDWRYPNLSERLNNLNLHWTSFEKVIKNMPRSGLQRSIATT